MEEKNQGAAAPRAATDRAIEKCVRIPIGEAITPREGYRVHVDRWWVVTPEREILLFRGVAPQCNSVQEIAAHVQRRLYPDCSVELLPTVFVPERP